MTALNVLVQADSVHLISDGASYGEGLELFGVGPKVLPLPHINAVIGARGPAIALPLLAHFVGQAATSYDDLKANIAVVLENARRNFLTVLDGCVLGAAFDVIICGISETTGPDAYSISYDADGVLAPVTAIPQVGFMPGTIPAIDDFLIFLSLRSHPQSPINAIDVTHFGIATMEMQRAAYLCSESACPVGGFCQITTVRQTGIETRVVHRWLDEIGKLVGDRKSVRAASGAIDSLAVRSLNIADQAVTVPNVATIASHLGVGTGQAIFNFNLSIDTTGLSGKTIPIFVSVFSSLSFTATSQAWDANLFINGTQVSGMSGTNGTFYYVSGAVNITGTGGVMSINVTQNWNCSAFGQIVNGVAFAQAAKR